MKKFAILTIALCLSAMILVGCGCMNTNADVTTLPTNGEMTKPTTAPSTAPSTEATTMPTTMPTTAATEDTGSTGDTGATSESTGPMEGAMDDILGGSTDDATDSSGAGRSRSRGSINPRG